MDGVCVGLWWFQCEPMPTRNQKWPLVDRSSFDKPNVRNTIEDDILVQRSRTISSIYILQCSPRTDGKAFFDALKKEMSPNFS